MYYITSMNTQMTPARIDAVIATAYNIHVGPQVRGEAMTPAKAVALPYGARLALCRLLHEKGGSDLYSQDDAFRAAAILDEGQPFGPGDTVKFADPQNEDEATERLEVLEMRGPRVLCRSVVYCLDWAIRPTGSYDVADLVVALDTLRGV